MNEWWESSKHKDRAKGGRGGIRGGYRRGRERRELFRRGLTRGIFIAERTGGEREI